MTLKNVKSTIYANEKKICTVFFFIYALITFIGIFTHEYSFDETQAWCIARDNDIAGVFNTLKFEGHPPLWYMIIYPFAKTGCPLFTLSLISWTFCAISAWLIMFKSPFNTFVKLSIVFSCGLIYHLSINSRSYCLILILLCLLAMIYPKRLEHPLIFGLLTGLMAITHVIMAGLVGIIGIYMIIDFFKNLKSASKKNNIMQIAGMFVALIGVILLVIPLLNSISSNNVTAKSEITLTVIINRIPEIFSNVGSHLCKFYYKPLFAKLIGNLVSLLFIVGLIVMRRYPRAVISFAVFTLFFLFATQIVYFVMLPPRACVYLYTFICIMWAAKLSGKPNDCNIKADENKIDNKFLKRIYKSLIKIDSNYNKTVSIIIALICAVSVPRGMYILFRDYNTNMYAVDTIVSYIRNNLSLDDSIYLYIGEPTCSQYTAEYPELKLFSVDYNRFVTYNPYSENTAEQSHGLKDSLQLLKSYKHIYCISNVYDKTMDFDSIDSVKVSPIYKNILITQYYPNEFTVDRTNFAVLSEVSVDDLIEFYGLD